MDEASDPSSQASDPASHESRSSSAGSNSSNPSSDLVYFKGPWGPDERQAIEKAAAVAEAAGLPSIVPEAGRPWVATKHAFPSFTLAMASRLKLGDTFTARGVSALAAQIKAVANRPREAGATGKRPDAGAQAPVFQLAYQSSAARPMDGEDLRELLRQSRAKNHRLAITGVLLYKAGAFLQVLEGGEAPVRDLYATIRDDPRHEDVETLLTTRAAHRLFPGWSMGLEDLTALSGEEPGVTSFLETGQLPTGRDPMPAVVHALEKFKQR